jgi:hypothetical protein
MQKHYVVTGVNCRAQFLAVLTYEIYSTMYDLCENRRLNKMFETTKENVLCGTQFTQVQRS